MDKVQVDSRKLQLLNDRINQTIDALNQVRVTAQQGFGIGHTTLPTANYAALAAQSMPFGFASPAISPYGFQHSSFVDPTVIARQQAELALLATRGIGASAVSPLFGGIGHTSPFRSPTADLVVGALDPVMRQLEYARASEANRAWELTQALTGGIGHTNYPFGANPWAMQTQGLGHTTYPFAANPWAAAMPITNPYVVGF